MLMHTIASASTIGHGHAPTSSRSGASKLAGPSFATLAAIAATASGSASVGCHESPGNAPAAATACSPVPLAISSTRPCRGKACSKTSRIAPRLRSAAGDDRT
jgi:hypothetical protein